MILTAILWLLSSSSIPVLMNRTFTDVVNTTYGMVRGKNQEIRPQEIGMSYASFMGIPYAKPPVGKLRFQAPQPPESWQGVLNATEERSMCPQFDRSNEYHGDEDCLYLNVYIPRTDLKNIMVPLPVFVFIYGGSFDTGSNNYTMYGPDYMMAQEVILVVPNYRLGPLGFACFPGITCNCGLRDQNMALRWVRDNIQNFGGNPNEVTLFGQSAGAVSVHAQMLSPMGKGLFARVIIQSGSLLCVWGYHSPVVAKAYVQKLADTTANSSVEESQVPSVLSAATAETLIRNTKTIFPLSPSFKVTCEKYQEDIQPFLPDCPFNIMRSGTYNRVPVIMGFITDEVLSFLRVLSNLDHYVNATSQTLTNDTSSIINQVVGNVFQKASNHIRKDVTDGIVDLGTDIFFEACIDLTEKMFTKNLGHNLFYYIYAYNGLRNVHRDVYGVDLDGVGHGDDLGEEFYVEALHPFPQNESVSSPMNQVAYNFTCLLTNFGKTGNPTPPERNCSKEEWPNSRQHEYIMNINTTLSVVPRQVNNRTKKAEALLYNWLKSNCGC